MLRILRQLQAWFYWVIPTDNPGKLFRLDQIEVFRNFDLNNEKLFIEIQFKNMQLMKMLYPQKSKAPNLKSLRKEASYNLNHEISEIKAFLAAAGASPSEYSPEDRYRIHKLHPISDYLVLFQKLQSDLGTQSTGALFSAKYAAVGSVVIKTIQELIGKDNLLPIEKDFQELAEKIKRPLNLFLCLNDIKTNQEKEEEGDNGLDFVVENSWPGTATSGSGIRGTLLERFLFLSQNPRQDKDRYLQSLNGLPGGKRLSQFKHLCQRREYSTRLKRGPLKSKQLPKSKDQLLDVIESAAIIPMLSEVIYLDCTDQAYELAYLIDLENKLLSSSNLRLFPSLLKMLCDQITYRKVACILRGETSIIKRLLEVLKTYDPEADLVRQALTSVQKAIATGRSPDLASNIIKAVINEQSQDQLEWSDVESDAEARLPNSWIDRLPEVNSAPKTTAAAVKSLIAEQEEEPNMPAAIPESTPEAAPTRESFWKRLRKALFFQPGLIVRPSIPEDPSAAATLPDSGSVREELRQKSLKVTEEALRQLNLHRLPQGEVHDDDDTSDLLSLAGDPDHEDPSHADINLASEPPTLFLQQEAADQAKHRLTQARAQAEKAGWRFGRHPVAATRAYPPDPSTIKLRKIEVLRDKLQSAKKFITGAAKRIGSKFKSVPRANRTSEASASAAEPEFIFEDIRPIDSAGSQATDSDYAESYPPSPPDSARTRYGSLPE